MRTILIHLPDSIPVIDIYGALHQLGLVLRSRCDGSILAVPGDPEKHGNRNVVPISKYRGQKRPKCPFDGPGAA